MFEQESDQKPRGTVYMRDCKIVMNILAVKINSRKLQLVTCWMKRPSWKHIFSAPRCTSTSMCLLPVYAPKLQDMYPFISTRVTILRPIEFKLFRHAWQFSSFHLPIQIAWGVIICKLTFKKKTFGVRVSGIWKAIQLTKWRCLLYGEINSSLWQEFVHIAYSILCLMKLPSASKIHTGLEDMCPLELQREASCYISEHPKWP